LQSWLSVCLLGSPHPRFYLAIPRYVQTLFFSTPMAVRYKNKFNHVRTIQYNKYMFYVYSVVIPIAYIVRFMIQSVDIIRLYTVNIFINYRNKTHLNCRVIKIHHTLLPTTQFAYGIWRLIHLMKILLSLRLAKFFELYDNKFQFFQISER
jgi:hypothetical protein